MKKDQIRIGGTYLAKVTDRLVPVRLETQNPHGGWDATNLTTGKKIRIKTAQRLRGPAPDRRAAAQAPETDTVTSSDAAPSAVTAGHTKTKKAGEPTSKKVSGLDAAYEVLKAKGEPMTCGAIVDEMLAKGMWKTSGKTPAQTIYSALVRHIDEKAGESRFVKTGRGLFTVAK